MQTKLFKLTQLVALTLLIATSPSFAAKKAPKPIPIDDQTFSKCITSMTPVRGFYVDNLTGKLDKTLAVARSDKGGTYPPGSVIQLVPTEVMVKQPPGTNPATKDWEFFELDATPEGGKIIKRGFVDVVNRFGGNCFACHAQARPEWDMVCETEHGCAPIPLTHAMKLAVQKSDPRCVPPNKLTDEDVAALGELSALLKGMTKP